MSTGIVLSLPLDKAGVGSAVNDTTREVGGAVGIAVLGSILNAQYRSGISSLITRFPAEVAAVARDGVSALAGLVAATPKGSDAAKAVAPLFEQAKHSFVDGMHTGLRVSAGVVFVVAVIVARWYPSGQLRPSGMAPHD